MTRREAIKSGLGALAAGVVASGLAGAQAARSFDLGQIVITWYPIFLYHLPVTVARELGEFERRGILIRDMVGARGGGETIRTLVAGNLLIGEAAFGAAVRSVWKSRDPYVIVGGGVKSPSDVFWIVPRNSPLRSIADLAGRRVGYTSPGSVTEQVLVLSLRKAGVPLDAVRLIAAGGIGEGLALLARGELDATAMLPSAFTRPDEFRILFNARDLVPDYFQTVILANRRLVENNPLVVRSFLLARRWGVRRIRERPEEAIGIYARSANISLELAKESFRIAGVVEGQYYSEGGFTAEGLRLAEEGLRVSKEIGPEERVPWRQIIDQRFLEADLRITLP